MSSDFDIDEHWERFDAAMADERLVDGTATVRAIEERDGDDASLAYFVLDVDVNTPGGNSVEATMPFAIDRDYADRLTIEVELPVLYDLLEPTIVAFTPDGGDGSWADLYPDDEDEELPDARRRSDANLDDDGLKLPGEEVDESDDPDWTERGFDVSRPVIDVDDLDEDDPDVEDDDELA